LRAFHLSASRNRKKRKKPVFILNFITTFGEKIIMKKLFDGAVSFRKKDFDKHKNLFVDLSHSQKPHTLFIGCSDSRLVPSLITSTIPGELFIIRSVANIIPPYKKGVNYPAISSAIEYAVLSLEVENIIVCGHSNCGGCGALYKTEEEMKNLPHTNLWLELSRPVKNRVMQMLPNATYAEREWMTEQMNVVQQINHLLTYPYVLERYNNNTLDIIGWYYVIEKGEIYNYEVEKGYFELINE
jgi:carbonic anhydrase